MRAMALQAQIKIRQPQADACLPDFPPFIQRILAARGISESKALNVSLQGLSDPFLMLGMHEAVERLVQLRKLNQRVLIVGDFDADGATSTSLMLKGLAALGFSRIDFLLPDRFHLGYGLSSAIVQTIVDAGDKPDVIITVDNGISSVEGVALANAHGIDVIVTDHHLPGDQTPDAYAIVNPNQRACQFPHKNLAGVGVAFHLLMALRKRLRQLGAFNQAAELNVAGSNVAEPNLAVFLDLVALGTVADVVSLDHYNRMLVVQGLVRIKQAKACVGIQALLRIAAKDYRYASAQDIAFALAPRLNAAGRLDDMNIGVRLLCSVDEDEAFELAQLLDGLNQDRKAIESQMRLEAEAAIEQWLLGQTQGEKDIAQHLPRVICLFNQNWHQGVVGLIASRLKERFHRPVLIFAPEQFSGAVHLEDKAADKTTILKGSGRSITGVHLRDLLDAVAKSSPKLLSKFGGHAMAAGLSIQAKHFDEFSALINRQAENFEASLFEPVVWIDGELEANEIGLAQAKSLAGLLPWGQGIPEPSFAGFFIIDAPLRILAEQHVKVSLRPCDAQGIASSSLVCSAIDFSADIETWLLAQKSASKMVHVIYKLSVNRFRGVEDLQLVIDFIV